MSDVKWIKLNVDMFDNRKIKHLRKLPEGDSIVLIWVMLLTMAGRCNAGGMIFLTENIPYTAKMLADELDFEEATIRLALDALEQLGMISMDQNTLFISGWQEHQNIDRLEAIREYNRLAKQRSREKQRLLASVNDTSMTRQRCQDTNKDIEEDIERDIEIYPSSYEEGVCEVSDETSPEKPSERISYQSIVDMYHSICVSFPHVTKLSDKRKKAIKARLTQYGLDGIRKAFEMAEASDFLKGKNDRDWQANYDWIMCESNMAKILDGNYSNNRNQRSGRKQNYQSAKEYNAEAESRPYVKDDLDYCERMLNKK